MSCTIRRSGWTISVRAHFPILTGRERVLDLGTGTGIIPLLIADHAVAVTAVEIDPVQAELAARNAELNGLTEKITVREGDYRDPAALFSYAAYDIVFANPPYRPVGRGALSMGARAAARHELTATLADVIRAAAFALRRGGRLAMVHLPERLGEIIPALHAAGLAMKRLRMVQPSADRPISSSWRRCAAHRPQECATSRHSSSATQRGTTRTRFAPSTGRRCEKE